MIRIRRQPESRERLSRPSTQRLTLGDLVSASVGQPLPEGRVWGGGRSPRRGSASSGGSARRGRPVPRSVEARLRRLERARVASRIRYVVVERPEDAPEAVGAVPGERVVVVVTGVPRSAADR